MHTHRRRSEICQASYLTLKCREQGERCPESVTALPTAACKDSAEVRRRTPQAAQCGGDIVVQRAGELDLLARILKYESAAAVVVGRGGVVVGRGGVCAA